MVRTSGGLLTLEVRLGYLRSDGCKPFSKPKLLSQVLGLSGGRELTSRKLGDLIVPMLRWTRLLVEVVAVLRLKISGQS